MLKRYLGIQNGKVCADQNIYDSDYATHCAANPTITYVENTFGVQKPIGYFYDSVNNLITIDPNYVDPFTQITTSGVPQVVSMRQARLALHAANKLSQVEAAITAMTGAEGDVARIEWEFSNTVERNKPLVASMATVLTMSDAELDALFVAASLL